MRILFVDDEPRVLDGIENLLFGEADDWDLLFANSGTEALGILDSEPVDVIVTDMRMPGMSGEELLDLVRSAHPSVVRIVLSGQTDREVADRCLRLVHDYLSKPCTADQLISTVTSAHAVAKSADTAGLRRMLGRLPGLPAEPGLYRRVRALIDADVDQRLIADELAGDMAVTVQLIHIANSAFYGFRTPATSLGDAVSRLGLNAVAAVVLAADSARGFGLSETSFVRRLNDRVGMVAGLLRSHRGGGPLEPLTAMVHDIGQMILHVCCDPEQRAMVDTRSPYGGPDRLAVEREVFGFDHCSAGGYLLRLWRLDPVVARAVEHHHTPWLLDAEDPARPLAARVGAAGLVIDGAASAESAPDWFVDLVDHLHRTRSGMTTDV